MPLARLELATPERVRILSPLCLPNFTTEAITKLMSKPFTKYDFITDLDYGKASEKTIAGILGLSSKEFEVKTERNWWTKTGNIAIELEYKGKPSGLNITEATYWVHVLQEADEPFCFVIIPVKKLKILVNKLIKSGEEPRMVGDGNNSKCLIVKKEILLNYELYREESNGKKTKS